MATNPQVNTPLQTRVYSDFDIDFLPHPVTGDLLKKTAVRSIVQSVVDLVQTNHYERPFHPEIGGNVRKLLFELASAVTANLLREEITDVLQNFEPRVSLVQIIVEATSNGNGYNVTVVFQIASVANPISITVFLARLR